MKVTAFKTRIFREGEDLKAFITKRIKKIPERSVLVVTSKIVSLSERRTAPGGNIRKRIALIKKESVLAIRTKYTWLTVKDGMVMSSAGIDESNADGKFILLPKDSFKAAELLRKNLKKHYRLKHFGILITDSRLMPLRAGITGVALGYAGFRGIRDYRGSKDIFGRTLTMSRTDLADSLAAAAVLLMGEGKERQPLALIENPPVEFSEKTKRNELRIDMKEDMYRPFFEKLGKTKRIRG
jgi:dihydrofolate synthase / folylpolyglutamate synthase